jgi:hypothetical protein
MSHHSFPPAQRYPFNTEQLRKAPNEGKIRPVVFRRQFLRIVENLDLGFGDLGQIKTLDKRYYGLQQGVGVTGFVSDHSESKGTELPFVLIFHFRHRNIKFTADPPQYAFYHLPLCFQ